MYSRRFFLTTVFATTFALAACGIGPTEHGSFDLTLRCATTIRVEPASASGSLHVNASSDGKVHVHGEVNAGSFLGSAKEELQRVISAPPIEQHGSLVRIGKDMSSFRNTSISYTIEVPRDTEL